jgi:hypothetical protein
MGYENSGRRPHATLLTVLRGNPGRKRLNAREPVPPAGEVLKPGTLSEGASQVWEELAPVCLQMGTLTVADVKPFAMLCELEASALVARRWKGKPRTLKAGLLLEKQVAAILRPYYALFGLEPISRARISVGTKSEGPVSKWAGALK